MKKIVLGLLVILFIAGTAYGQECGPNCPVCSGAGSSSGALLSQKSILVSGLIIPSDDEETTVINARYGILKWLDAGVGYAIKTKKALWNIRTQPLLEQENGWRPGLILGTGSVQTGGSDQSVYAQVIKSLEIYNTFGLQLSAGAATLVPDLDEIFGLGGVTVSFKERYAVFASYDGKSYHEGVSWSPSEWLSLSFLMVESESPAISIVFRK